MDYSKQDMVVGKLSMKKVAVVGLGGLGNFVSMQLALAGFDLKLIDFDLVEKKNLHRTPLFTAADVGKHKAEAAAFALQKMNPDIDINYYNFGVRTQLLENCDIVIDCTDNFEAKYLLNDYCFGKKLFITGSITGFDGQVLAVNKSACLRCVIPNGSTEECAVVGAVPSFVAMVASAQAGIAINYAAYVGVPVNKLLVFNARKMTMEEVNVNQREDCSCSKMPLKV